jgi:hypothetical protein
VCFWLTCERSSPREERAVAASRGHSAGAGNRSMLSRMSTDDEPVEHDLIRTEFEVVEPKIEPTFGLHDGRLAGKNYLRAVE